MPSYQNAGSSCYREVSGLWQYLLQCWLGRYDTVYWHWLGPNHH